MSKSSLRRALYGALFLVFVLRLDFWQWHDSRRLLGLPVGLTYHIGVCLAVSLITLLLVRFAWPPSLTTPPDSADDS